MVTTIAIASPANAQVNNAVRNSSALEELPAQPVLSTESLPNLAPFPPLAPHSSELSPKVALVFLDIFLAQGIKLAFLSLTILNLLKPEWF